MLRKFVLAAVLAAAPFALLAAPQKAHALSYVDMGHPYYLKVFMVQYKCPQTGNWINYQECTTNQEIQTALGTLYDQGYTSRYIQTGTKTYYWTFPAGHYSFGRWEEAR